MLVFHFKLIQLFLGLECDLSGHRIQWHDDRSVNNFIQYDGIPHVTIGHYELHCQFGVDKSAAQKEKRRKMKVILCFP